jgi:hypothetical protein
MKYIVAILLLFVAVPATAQTVKLGPNDSLNVTWPAYVNQDPDGLDAPDGYRVKAVKPTQTGVVVQTYSVGLVTNLTLTAAQLPAGAFSISVHPFSVAGEAAASNVVGPFGKAAIPRVQTGVAATRVSGAP